MKNKLCVNVPLSLTLVVFYSRLINKIVPSGVVERNRLKRYL